MNNNRGGSVWLNKVKSRPVKCDKCARLKQYNELKNVGNRHDPYLICRKCEFNIQ